MLSENVYIDDKVVVEKYIPLVNRIENNMVSDEYDSHTED